MAVLRLVDSITELRMGADTGCVAVSGSHGGATAARFALAVRPRLSVFNDAGGGRDDAGFSGLALLQAQGLAACTVSHTSARIGDAHSTLNDGIISRVNEAAGSLGLAPGQKCKLAVDALSK